MPFLEGIPCSIHGLVFPDYVSAFRPVEIVVLRKPHTHEFLFAGTATYWDPDPADRTAMRALAKRVGTALSERVQYRGAFTIDGVMTKDGFRPTELNTRSGSGVRALLGDEEFLLQLLIQALVSGADLDYQPDKLEALIIETADNQRGGGTWCTIQAQLPYTEPRQVKLTESGWAWAEREASDGTVRIIPRSIGTYVSLTPATTSVKLGRPFGPLASKFWQFADRSMGTKLGPLEPAVAMR